MGLLACMPFISGTFQISLVDWRWFELMEVLVFIEASSSAVSHQFLNFLHHVESYFWPGTMCSSLAASPDDWSGEEVGVGRVGAFGIGVNGVAIIVDEITLGSWLAPTKCVFVDGACIGGV